METEAFDTQVLKLTAIIVAVSYLSFRFSAYGVDKTDRVLMRGISLLFALLVPAALFSNYSGALKALVYVVGGVSVVLMLAGGIPGLRVKISNDHARNRLSLETGVTVIAVLIVQLIVGN